MKVKLHLYFYFLGDIMKNSKEKWKLEPLVGNVCLITTIFYGAIITFIGLLYLVMYLSPNGTLENSAFGGLLFGVLLVIYIPLYYSKLIYIIPVVSIFFIFGGTIGQEDFGECVHPLILSSIITTVVGTVLLLRFIESAF